MQTLQNMVTVQTPADRLFQLLRPARLTAVVDIGANPTSSEPPYRRMLMHGLCTLTGFEPQRDALATLQARQGALEHYLPYAVANGGTRTLYRCRASGMTSLLQPNPRMLGLFHGLAGWGEVLSEETVETHRLDDVGEITALDFLKIDVQGSELEVFRGGQRKLQQTIAIQTEVSFLPLYENQPVFSEIDTELRTQGFIPHAFAAIKCPAIAPFIVNNDLHQGLHQLLEADIVYVRDFTRTESLDDEQLKHLALVAHHCYGSYDLALHCVLALERRGSIKTSGGDSYMEIARAHLGFS